MPISSNTKPGDLGHAQVLRDIEYLYMMIGGGGTEGAGDGQMQDGTNLDPDLKIGECMEDGAVGISINTRIDRLCWWMDELRRRIGNIQTVKTLKVGKGQTLYNSGGLTVYGISYNTSPGAVTIPTVDPVVGSTYSSGLGYGWLLDSNGEVAGDPVWIVNRAPSADMATQIPATDLPEDSIVATKYLLSYEVSPGVFTQAYLAWRV